MDTKKWDTYWFKMCNTIAENSSCLSRKIGAIIVKDNKYPISFGYNGPPTGCAACSDNKYRAELFNHFLIDNPDYDGDLRILKSYLVAIDAIDMCPRRFMGFPPLSGSGYEYCQAAHAERNAVDMAARNGHSTEGHTMYMDCAIPCRECAKTIIQAGITEIVVAKITPAEKRGITGQSLLINVGVRIRTYVK